MSPLLERMLKWFFIFLWIVTLALAVSILCGCATRPDPRQTICDPKVYLPSGKIVDPRDVR